MVEAVSSGESLRVLSILCGREIIDATEPTVPLRRDAC